MVRFRADELDAKVTITTSIGNPVFAAALEASPAGHYTVSVRHENGHTASAATADNGRTAFIAIPVGLITFYLTAKDPQGVSLRTAWLRY